MHLRRIHTSLVRRLLRCEEKPAQVRWIGSQLSPSRQQVRRGYATPPPSPAQRLKGGRLTPGSIPREHFAFEDKQMLEVLALGAVRSLSREDAADAPAFLASTKKYFQALTKNPRMSAAALEKAYGLPPSELLRLGAMVITGTNNAHYWRLGTQMLMTASAAGHMPATLSLLQFFATLGKESLSAFVYQDSVKRLMSYLKTSTGQKDPDALTVAGLHTALAKEKEGWAQLAVDYFMEAIRVGSPIRSPGDASTDSRGGGEERRSARWLTEASCYAGLGELFILLEQIELARWALRIAALELDIPEAYSMLARLLPSDAPEKETYLTKAAMSNNREAMLTLAQVLQEKAAKEPDGGDGPAQLRMAREWEAMASGSSGDQNSAAVAA